MTYIARQTTKKGTSLLFKDKRFGTAKAAFEHAEKINGKVYMIKGNKIIGINK